MANNNSFDILGLSGNNIYGTEFADPLSGYKPTEIPKFTAAKAPKIEKPTKTELKEAQQRAEDVALATEATNFQQNLLGQDWWNSASVERKQELIEHYENNVWPDYARQRFGDDHQSANRLKGMLLNDIKQRVRSERLNIYNAGNYFDALGESLKEGWRQATTWGHTFSMMADYLTGNGETSQEDIANFANTLRQHSEARLAAQKANAYLENDARRRAELTEEGDDTFQTLTRMKESGTTGAVVPLANLILSQWSNIAAMIGSSVAGAALGSAVAPGAGTAAGATAGGAAARSAMGSLQVVSGVASQITDEIYNMPEERIAQSPVYKELREQGQTPQQARTTMVNRAIGEVITEAAALGAISGVVSPEALFARSGTLAGLLGGGMGRRFVAGGVIGAVEEAPQEGYEQYLGNVGYNVGTGENRDTMQGVGRAAFEGALVGGAVGSAGGVLGNRESSNEGKANSTPSPNGTSAGDVDRGTSTQQGGINVPGQNESVIPPSDSANASYNEQAVRREQRRTAAMHSVSEAIDRIYASPNQFINANDLQYLFQNLAVAREAGVTDVEIDGILSNVQVAANKSIATTIDVKAAWQRYQAEQTTSNSQADPTSDQHAQPNAEQNAAPQSDPIVNVQTLFANIDNVVNEIITRGQTVNDAQLNDIMTSLRDYVRKATETRRPYNKNVTNLFKLMTNNAKLFGDYDLEATWLAYQNDEANPIVHLDGTRSAYKDPAAESTPPPGSPSEEAAAGAAADEGADTDPNATPEDLVRNVGDIITRHRQDADRALASFANRKQVSKKDMRELVIDHLATAFVVAHGDQAMRDDITRVVQALNTQQKYAHMDLMTMFNERLEVIEKKYSGNSNTRSFRKFAGDIHMSLTMLINSVATHFQRRGYNPPLRRTSNITRQTGLSLYAYRTIRDFLIRNPDADPNTVVGSTLGISQAEAEAYIRARDTNNGANLALLEEETRIIDAAYALGCDPDLYAESLHSFMRVPPLYRTAVIQAFNNAGKVQHDRGLTNHFATTELNRILRELNLETQNDGRRDQGTGQEGASAEADPGTGTGSEGTPAGDTASGETAAPNPANDTADQSQGPESPAGDNADTESTGTGGSPEQNAGETAGDILNDQQVQSDDGSGTDDGSGDPIIELTDEAPDSGPGELTGEARQRADDGRFAAVFGQLQDAQDSIERDNILNDFREERHQLYRGMGLSEVESRAQAQADTAIVLQLYEDVDFLCSYEGAQDFQWVANRIERQLFKILKWEGTRNLISDERAAEVQRSAALITRMLITLSTVGKQNIRTLVTQLAFNQVVDDRAGYYEHNTTTSPSERHGTLFINKKDGSVQLMRNFLSHFMHEAWSIIDDANPEMLRAAPPLRSFLEDMQTLYRSAGLQMDKQNRLTDESLSKLQDMFTKYITEGKAPEYTGLGRFFEQMKKIAKAFYLLARKIINGQKKYIDFDDTVVLNDETRAVFDHMFTSYADRTILERLGITVDADTAASFNAQFANIFCNLLNKGFDASIAYTRAADGIRNILQVSVLDAASQARLAIFQNYEEQLNRSADIIVETANDPTNITLDAILNMRSDPDSMDSWLAIYGSKDTDYALMDLLARIPNPLWNSRTTDDTVGNGTSPDPEQNAQDAASLNANAPTNESTAEAEQEAAGEAVNEEVRQENVPPTNENSGESTQNGRTEQEPPAAPEEQEAVAEEVARNLVTTRAQNERSYNIGRFTNAQALIDFKNTQFGPRFMANAWMRFVAKTRAVMVDAGSFFRLWCIENFSNANSRPEDNPIYQSFLQINNRIDGAANIYLENVLSRIYDWAYPIAKGFGASDPTAFLKEVGLYMTALHTKEAAMKHRVEMQQALQQAYAMPSGTDKAKAIADAERAIEEFNLRQQGVLDPNGNNYNVYGGRSESECDAIIAELEAKYTRDVLQDGLQHLSNGYSWLTRFLMENGLISRTDMQAFDNWNFYCSLATEINNTESMDATDITFFAPRNNYHRGGSKTPAADAYTNLIRYGARAVRSVGMSDFNRALRSGYEMLAADDNNITRIIGNNPSSQIRFYNGMALVDSTQYASIKDNMAREGNAEGVKFCESMETLIRNKSGAVIRVVEQVQQTDARGNPVVDTNGNPVMEEVTKTYRVLFDSSDPHYKEVMDSLVSPTGKIDPTNLLDRTVNNIGKITTGYASLSTRFRALFPVVNSPRDLFERLSYMPQESFITQDGRRLNGYALAGEMIAFACNPRNLWRIGRWYFTGSSGDADFDIIMRDFKASGIEQSTSYMEMLKQARKNLQNELEERPDLVHKKLNRSVWHKVNRALFRYQDMFYSMAAIAHFTVLRNNNVSMRDTITGVLRPMNMQQRGHATRIMSMFFPFVSSVMQTSSNMLAALGLNSYTLSNHPQRGKMMRRAVQGWAVMFGSYAAFRALIPILALDMGEGDDEEGFKILDAMALTSLASGIPIALHDPDHPGSYFKFPNGFGLTNLAALMAFGQDRLERGRITAGDLGFTLFVAFSKSIVPNSMPAFNFSQDPIAFIAQTFCPVFLMPFAQVATNRSYSGAQITYESFDRYTRKSDQYNLATHRAWVRGAKWLHDVSKGILDFAPEQVRAVANGYLMGSLQAIIAWIESDPLYKNKYYASTREVLGPLWTALGASVFYSTGPNMSAACYGTVRDYMIGRIKAAGIGHRIKGEEWEKRQVLLSAGFELPFVNDFMTMLKADKELADINKNTRAKLDKLWGPDLNETGVREAYQEWADARNAVETATIDKLNYFQKGYRPVFDVPDKQAAGVLRREVKGLPVENATADVLAYAPRKNDSGQVEPPVIYPFYSTNSKLWMLLPRSLPDGRILSEAEARQLYVDTGQHFGTYRTETSANEAMARIQDRYRRYYGQN